MVVKYPGEKHFTRELGGGSFSHRVILPGRDSSRVKVTEFTGAKGEHFDGISYSFDETVRITRGYVKISSGDVEHAVGVGGTFHVSAGEIYSITFVEETEAICFFSQGADGTLPEDEPNP